ncbi:MAG: MarR family transcriptional regulator [Deltaproteobacteria bacterium]|nr:MarR family transcriptional regulator [Deltaproteobacteria bacterium]
MTISLAGSAAELLYKTLPLMKKIFLGTPEGQQGKLPHHLFPTLLCLHFNGRQKMSVISDRLGLSKPLVTQHVDRLVAEGYLERSADPSDRRIIHIDITSKGSKYAKEVSSYFRQRGEKALSSLSPEDLDRFIKSMQTLQEILSGIDRLPKDPNQ